MDLTLGVYDIEVASAFGPRVSGLRRRGGTEQFATVAPNVALEHDTGLFRFRGGHRLWAAPESPAVTYAPDDHACELIPDDHRVTISAPPDAAGMVKEIVLSAAGDALMVEHRISAATGLEIEAAPWALTQMPLGGVAILPVVGEDTTPLPDRQIVLWPYTDLSDSRIRIRDEAVIVFAEDGPDLKVGTGPATGRVGYFKDGWLFVKTLEASGGGEVPDLGAVRQVFVGMGFCELECLGGVVDLASGTVATLVERWQVLGGLELDDAIDLVVGATS